MRRKGFISKLREIAQRDTSADPSGWSPDNPLWGHCAVGALLAQDHYGGDLIRGSLEDIPKYAHLRSHYWNRIDGEYVDFTSEPYPDISYQELQGEICDRERVLRYEDTVRRYQLLNERFNQ